MYQPDLQVKERKRDLRLYLRKQCYLPVIKLTGEVDEDSRILDISVSGLFLETKHLKQPGEQIRTKFIIPKSHTSIEFLGEVVHLKSKEGLNLSGMGIRFIEINDKYQKPLKNYILDHTFGESLRQFQSEFKSSRKNIKPMSDPESILLIFSSAVEQRAPIDVLLPKAHKLTSASLTEVNMNNISLSIPGSPAELKTYHQLLARLSHKGNHYFFETIIKQINCAGIIMTFPHTIYFEERRVEKRESFIGKKGETASIEFYLNDQYKKRISYKINNFNSSGLSFICPSHSSYLTPGNTLNGIHIIKETSIEEKGNAVIVHISQINNNEVQVGLQFLLERQPYEFFQINSRDIKLQKSFSPLLDKTFSKLVTGIKNILIQTASPHFSVHLVKYQNKDAEEITAILNATIDLTKRKGKISAPVVIIPPAYARRKETTNLLALTIIETFKREKKDVVIIRFDGIRSMGESFNDLECQHQNSQMSHYTLSQLVDDIQTTISFSKNNTYFTPTNFIIVSFSMASVAARRAIYLDEQKDITYWISCMGASDPDDLMQNSTGGIDYLQRHKEKETLSVKEVLGHLVDMDRFCNDILSNEMASLEDSRREMAQISIPVTWIYGKYDYWINENRIKDIMSIKAPGPRRLYELPSGHIVKTSEEAIRAFKLITQCAWEHLYQTDIEAVAPSSWYRACVERNEWSRIKNRELNSRDYWRSYLLEEDSEGIGFDIITLTDEYQELMDKQIELLDLEQSDRIIDLGGGTGNFAQYLMSKTENSGIAKRLPYIFMIDLVHQALLKAREKHRLSCATNHIQNFHSGYIEANLEFKDEVSRLPIRDNSTNKVLASLFISYIQNPRLTLKECLRVLKPGGRIIVSSMKPDTDMSKPVYALREKIQTSDYLPYFQNKKRDDLLKSVQVYINSAASLTDLEEEKHFKFFNKNELIELMTSSGFHNIQLYETFGDPPQAIIAIGFK